VNYIFIKVSTLLLLIKAELKRELLFLKRYPFETLSFVFFMYVTLMAIFLGLSQLSNQGGLDLNHNRMILGYCLMQFVMSTQMGWAGQISNESQTGTLEQLSISGHSLAAVLFARGVAQFFRQTTHFFLLLGGYIYSIPQATIAMQTWFLVIPLLFLIALGVYGIAYLFAGLTLLFKRVGFFFQVINFAFLGLFWQNRTALEDGSVLANLYDYFPLTLGMWNLEQLMTGKTTEVFLLFAHQLILSLLYCLGGYLIFRQMEKRAREMALLSQY